MTYLAFDTCCGHYSVALFNDEFLLKNYYLEELTNFQSRDLLQKIKLLLEEENLSIDNISEAILTVGPGSFTGLRIGIAAIQGLAFDKNIKIHAISSLQALSLRSSKLSITYIEAGKGQVYAQIFKNYLPQSEIWVESRAKIELLAPTYNLVTNSYELQLLPNAKDLIKIKLISDLPTLPLEPLYIRQPDVKIPSK